MRILIVRHGDPDYANDTVTEKGKREVELLADRLEKEKIDYFYVSTMGRAKATCQATLNRVNKKAVEFDWLREFQHQVENPFMPGHTMGTWDFYPDYWTKDERYFSYKDWHQTELFKAGEIEKHYKNLCDNLDALLEKHGYKRDGKIYKAVRANKDTIAFFCHFGVESYILSHLLNVSPLVITHGFCALPSSVTTLITEERKEGIASFRCLTFGDTTHLYVGDEEPSFSARFCETFDSEDRH